MECYGALEILSLFFSAIIRTAGGRIMCVYDRRAPQSDKPLHHHQSHTPSLRYGAYRLKRVPAAFQNVMPYINRVRVVKQYKTDF